MVSNVITCHSQEKSAEPTFADLQVRFDEAAARVNQPITQLNISYTEALKRLLASETAAGNLDGALLVKAEIEKFADGIDFSPKSFTSKHSEHPTIRGMQITYLAERERLWNLSKRSREELLKNYRTTLTSLEQEHTKRENFDAALAVRKAREALNQDPRFHEGISSARVPESFPARIHFIAKGEVELRLNGERLPYRNASPDRYKYIDGTSGDAKFSVGEIIVVSMRATAVYRGFVMTIESTDGKTAVPVKLNDYRYLGGALDGRELNPDIETFDKIANRPDEGAADPDMATMWGEKPISALSRAGSEWIKCGPGEDWHHYAVLLRSEMLLPVSD